MTPLSVKPKVHYRADRHHSIQLGRSAVIYPLAHPSEFVTGDGETPAITSTVMRVEDNGEFWTINTHYIPDYRTQP